MEIAEKTKPVLVLEDEPVIREPLHDSLTEEAIAELSSWDKEGRIIVKQIINRFPYLFPYYFR